MDGNRTSGSEGSASDKGKFKNSARYTISGGTYLILHLQSTSGWKRVRPRKCYDSEPHFRPHIVGVSMSANNAKSGNWCRLPSRSFSSRCARMKVVPRWFPDLRQIVPHFATKEPRRIPIACEIRFYQEYELGYRKLATALGRVSSKPAPRELELLRLLIDRRANP